MQITCNNVPRPMLYWHDLTVEERSEFDWIEEDDNSYGFFRYRGAVYCLADFMRPPHDLAEKRWHGYMSDTYFSAVLVRFVDMGESVIVARAYA